MPDKLPTMNEILYCKNHALTYFNLCNFLGLFFLFSDAAGHDIDSHFLIFII